MPSGRRQATWPRCRVTLRHASTSCSHPTVGLPSCKRVPGRDSHRAQRSTGRVGPVLSTWSPTDPGAIPDRNRTGIGLDPPLTGTSRVGTSDARMNFTRVDEVQPRFEYAVIAKSSRQRPRQTPAEPRSRDCASPLTDRKGMTADSRQCAGPVPASRGPVSRLAGTSTARCHCPGVHPSTLAPKGRDPVSARVHEVRPDSYPRVVTVELTRSGPRETAHTAPRDRAATPGTAA